MLSHLDQSKKEEEVKQQEEDERLQGGGAEVDALQQAGLEDEVWGENSSTSLLQSPPLGAPPLHPTICPLSSQPSPRRLPIAGEFRR